MALVKLSRTKNESSSSECVDARFPGLYEKGAHGKSETPKFACLLVFDTDEVEYEEF